MRRKEIVLVFFAVLISIGCTVSDKSPKALVEAAEKGDISLVRRIIRQGTDPNATNHHWTALHAAAIKGNTQLASLLIRKGADINSLDKLGATPLYYAASYGHNEFIKLLIDKGANINTFTYRGRTAIMQAVSRKLSDTTSLLIDEGADVYSTNLHGSSLLHIAVYVSDMEIVKLLIAKGANINSPDVCGWTPLHTACYVLMGEKNSRIVEYLLDKGADADAKTVKSYVDPMEIKSGIYRYPKVPAGYTPLDIARLMKTDEKNSGCPPCKRYFSEVVNILEVRRSGI